METRLHAQQKTAPTPSFTPVRGGVLQRKCACGESSGISGECEECGKQGLSLQRSTGNSELETRNSDGVPPIVDDVLRSSGQPLDAETRAFMEPRFGHDFSRVRVHADARAAASAQAVNAMAYTVGANIVFDSGQYATGTEAGRQLLAHELTHVVQQGNVPLTPQARLVVGEPRDQFEQEADRVSEAVMKGSELQQRIAGIAGVGEMDDDEAAISQDLNVDSTTRPSRTTRPRAITPGKALSVQRAASFQLPGDVHPVNNAATQIANGGFAGQTWMTLNGTKLVDEASARAAIKDPSTTAQATLGSAECWLTSVDNNVGSVDETVLTNGPWNKVTAKANLGARLGLSQCSGADDATLTANGRPSDADVATANRTHEDHHARDDETVFNATIAKWDKLLVAAMNSKQKFQGTDITACEAALASAMGGTPEEIAVNYRNDSLRAGAAFHQPLPDNGDLRGSNQKADAACNAVTIDVRQ